jgi:hypothetical protein
VSSVIGFLTAAFFVYAILQPSPQKRKRTPHYGCGRRIRTTYPRVSRRKTATKAEPKAVDTSLADDLFLVLRGQGYSSKAASAACNAASGGSFDERLRSALAHAARTDS